MRQAGVREPASSGKPVTSSRPVPAGNTPARPTSSLQREVPTHTTGKKPAHLLLSGAPKQRRYFPRPWETPREEKTLRSQAAGRSGLGPGFLVRVSKVGTG